MFSCKKEENKNQIPDALNDDKISVRGSFRSYDEDLVDKLYSELIKNDKELQNFDNKIQNTFEKSHEVKKDLITYDSKSKNYYSTAIENANSIKDSILKKRLIEVVKKSETKYNLSISNLKKLSGIIESNNASIADNYKFFKTSITLPIIEKFQQENLPKSKPLENFLTEQNKTKGKIEIKNK